jgi:hypothetical protein
MSDRRHTHEGDPGRAPGGEGTDGAARRVLIVAVIVLAVILLGAIIFLHLNGTIGPGVH